MDLQHLAFCIENKKDFPKVFEIKDYPYLESLENLKKVLGYLGEEWELLFLHDSTKPKTFFGVEFRPRKGFLSSLLEKPFSPSYAHFATKRNEEILKILKGSEMEKTIEQQLADTKQELETLEEAVAYFSNDGKPIGELFRDMTKLDKYANAIKKAKIKGESRLK